MTSFQVIDESLREVEKILARSELSSAPATTTSNIRPGYKPSIKPLIDNNLNGSTSYRSASSGLFMFIIRVFPGHFLTPPTTAASPGLRRRRRRGRV